MKRVWLIVIALLMASSALSQTATPPQTLRLTTKIIDQQYCDSGYPDMTMLRLKLRLKYTNVSKQPLILYKGSDLMHYVLVSANEQDAANKHYEANIHVGWITNGPRLAESARPGTEFIVLTPGGSYETNGGGISIPIDLNSTSKFLKAGQHVFQGVTETWPGKEEQFDRLKKKWEKVGVLWENNVRSEPMALTIDKNPKLVQCQ